MENSLSPATVAANGSFVLRLRNDQILAVPTLVRRVPVPVRKIIGDLSNTQRVLAGLDVSIGAA